MSKQHDFWKQIFVIIIGTTISILLTIGSSQLLERRQRAKDRQLTAMMVMSSIEGFVQSLDEVYEYTAWADTVSEWLMSRPLEEMALLDQDILYGFIQDARNFPYIPYDKTAENIFSNNIDTWKNIDNAVFVENVGHCFSIINQVKEYWKEQADELNGAFDKVLENTDAYPGDNLYVKQLGCNEVRQKLVNTHNLRCWLKHIAELLRYENRKNMALIGVSETELKGFIENRDKEIEVDMEKPNDDFYTPNPNIDNQPIFKKLNTQIDSLMKVGK